MNKAKRLLLITALSPLILLLYLALINQYNKTSVRILIWESPELSIGTWMIIGSTGGALISAFSALSFPSSNSILKRTIKKNITNNSQVNQQNNTELHSNYSDEWQVNNYKNNIKLDSIPPQRDLREPSPTLSVPYKIKSRPANNNYSQSSNNTFNQNIDNHAQVPEVKEEEPSWDDIYNEDW